MVIILINDLKPLYTNSCSHTYTYGQSNYVKVIRKKDFSILGQKYIISKKWQLVFLTEAEISHNFMICFPPFIKKKKKRPTDNNLHQWSPQCSEGDLQRSFILKGVRTPWRSVTDPRSRAENHKDYWGCSKGYTDANLKGLPEAKDCTIGTSKRIMTAVD